MNFIDDDALQDTLLVLEKFNGNQTLAAMELGIARSTLQNRLRAATARGIIRSVGGAIPVSLDDPTLPLGLALKGVSTYFKSDGTKGGQWVLARKDPSVEEIVPLIAEAMKGITSPAILSDPVPPPCKHLLTVYPIPDLHMGMYSWKAETGNSYDVDIAAETMRKVMKELVASSPPSAVALSLNLGDFFHADTDEGRTRRSGNILDTDTRFARVLKIGVETRIASIQLALQHHDRVIVRDLPGNHDPYATLALNQAVAMYFHNEPRVIVDTSPSPFLFLQHGRTLIGATHGDMVKPVDMINVMSTKAAVAWGQTSYRYALMGHIHRKSKGQSQTIGEQNGAVWETFQTLAPRDAWGNSMGFTAGRSLQSITYSDTTGEWKRITVAIKGAE